MSEQSYRDVLSRLEAKDKKPMTTEEAYDALSFLPGTGDVIGAYEAPAIIQAGVDKMGEDSLIEKAKGVGIATLGGMGFLPVVGGPARKAAKIFSKIDTPVYHFSKNTDPGFTKFDTKRLSWFDLGPHVGSTPKAAQDRFLDETFGVGARLQIRKKMQELDVGRDEAIDNMLRSGELEVPLVTGNVGYNKFNMPRPRKTLGGSIPLKADLSKPLLNPDTKKPFTENQLMEFQAEKYSEARGKNFTADDILSEDPDVDIADVKMFMRKFAKDLAEEGYTHIPYLNAVEDTKNLSYIMLVDRPKGSTKVLQSPFAKKDAADADDPDFMKAKGGVVEMKDKAVNMYRGTQGIEPFIKYMV
jgi:hypothetical protein